MPEIPDVELYVHALSQRIVGTRLTAARVLDPFVLRSVAPPLAALHGRRVERVGRLAKRLLFAFEEDHYLVVHLMIAGRLQWSAGGARRSRPKPLAELAFEPGTLILTEAGTTRRASIHVVQGAANLAAHQPAGIDPLTAPLEAFRDALRRENHTLKRSLTDQRLVAGIGNAYSDEILHRARLSPLQLTGRLGDEDIARLYAATQESLRYWIAHLRAETGADFPGKVTAFRPDMAVHGKFGQPCPVCGSPIQRIVYTANQCNYCATCQTGGRRLADRAMSRLLGDDWPREVEE
jgi:formamidopyrimidine-DNA glycosylase